jgi:hypothetical protein
MRARPVVRPPPPLPFSLAAGDRRHRRRSPDDTAPPASMPRGSSGVTSRLTASRRDTQDPGRLPEPRSPSSSSAQDSDPDVDHPAAISVGSNPTFAGVRRTVEAYLLDWDGDLYGRTSKCVHSTGCEAWPSSRRWTSSSSPWRTTLPVLGHCSAWRARCRGQAPARQLTPSRRLRRGNGRPWFPGRGAGSAAGSPRFSRATRAGRARCPARCPSEQHRSRDCPA